jgi:hypothetical protein
MDSILMKACSECGWYPCRCDPDISWPRAALSGVIDLVILTFGLAGLLSLLLLAAAAMGKL